MYIFLIFSALILLFPIPIKLRITLSNNKLCVYLYKNKLNINTFKKIFNKKKDHKNKDKPKNKNSSLKLKILFKIFKKSRFKPKLKFDLNAKYSLEDAAFTAVISGLLCNIYPIIYINFKNLFKIKHFKIDMSPVFKNTNYINLKLDSIFYINLAKVIYIGIIFLVRIKKQNLSLS